jgi:hypothetical protein
MTTGWRNKLKTFDSALGDIKMRVLIVEDDAALGLFLQKGLKLEGHEVAWETGRQHWYMPKSTGRI